MRIRAPLPVQHLRSQLSQPAIAVSETASEPCYDTFEQNNNAYASAPSAKSWYHSPAQTADKHVSKRRRLSRHYATVAETRPDSKADSERYSQAQQREEEQLVQSWPTSDSVKENEQPSSSNKQDLVSGRRALSKPLHKLLRHPTLFDPIRAPRHPIVS